jgi:hypothetical protein
MSDCRGAGILPACQGVVILPASWAEAQYSRTGRAFVPNGVTRVRKDEPGAPRGLNRAVSCLRACVREGHLNWKWLMVAAPLPLTGCLPAPDAAGPDPITAVEQLGQFAGDLFRHILAAFLL